MLNEDRAFKTVSILDPSIDVEAMGFAVGIVDWVQNRDFDRLHFRPGANPVTFHLKALKASRAHQVTATATSERETWLRLFRSCVVRVDNINGHLAWEPESARDSRAPQMTDTELDVFDLATVYEIGAVAHSLCFFPRSTVPTFVLPPLSGQIWDSLHGSRRAEEPKTSTTNGPSEPTPDAG